MAIRLPRRFHNTGLVKGFCATIIGVSLLIHLLPKLNPDLADVTRPNKYPDIKKEDLKPYDPIKKM
ncbi:hypothetical protein ACHWQZ_G015507 [Mnemiopsis leidyi]